MKKYISIIFLISISVFILMSCGAKEEPQAEELPATLEEQQTPVIEEVPSEADTTVPAEEAAAEEVQTEEAVAGETAKEEQDAPPPPPPSDGVMKGKVISLEGLAKGRPEVDEAEAKRIFGKGAPLMFQTDDGNVYFVYSAGGSYAGKDLVKYARANTLGVIGKVKNVNGIKIIIADKIKPID